ncbi:hypothetical protein NW759_010563 [Fusarium solani]|nr:hypothetical protein NW759_010563 [Fusarium solani]
MCEYVGDTVFGQLVRLLSKRRLLKCPDEINPKVYEQFVKRHTDTSSDSKIPEHTGNLEENKTSQHNDQNDGIPDESGLRQNATDMVLVDCSRKLLVTVQICILNFGIYIGSSIYTPGELSVMEEFGASEIVATLGLSLFVLGYGLGPMLFSPMSEMPQIGRSRIYFWTLFAFVLLELPTGYATSMAMLLVFRFLTDFFGSPVLATGGATIMDMYPPVEVPYWISIFGSVGILGLVMGPLIGGFAAQAKGWRWTIWELTWLCAAVLTMIFFLMPETSQANILYRRAKRLRVATSDSRLKSQSEVDAEGVTVKDNLIFLARAFTLTFSEPVVVFVDLYCALIYSILYLWFESSPLVFGDIYGFKIGLQGVVFLGIFVGGILTLPCYLYWIQKHLVPTLKQPPILPEVVLPPTFFGAVALPICLFWYGWTARSRIHWMVPLVGPGSFTVSIITLFMPVLNYLGMAYPQYAASVLAGNALFRASCGVVFPLFARALFRNLGIGPGNSLLGGLSILFIPIPFILSYRGERLRHRSKNATHAV